MCQCKPFHNLIRLLINCEIRHGDHKWLCSFVYASNNGIDKRHLWSHPVSFKQQCEGNPWFFGGDFNVVKSTAEKSSSKSLSSYEYEFEECMYNQMNL